MATHQPFHRGNGTKRSHKEAFTMHPQSSVGSSNVDQDERILRMLPQISKFQDSVVRMRTFETDQPHKKAKYDMMMNIMTSATEVLSSATNLFIQEFGTEMDPSIPEMEIEAESEKNVPVRFTFKDIRKNAKSIDRDRSVSPFISLKKAKNATAKTGQAKNRIKRRSQKYLLESERDSEGVKGAKGADEVVNPIIDKIDKIDDIQSIAEHDTNKGAESVNPMIDNIEPAIEPVMEATIQPTIENVVEPVAEPVVEPVQPPIQQPIQPPVADDYWSDCVATMENIYSRSCLSADRKSDMILYESAVASYIHAKMGGVFSDENKQLVDEKIVLWFNKKNNKPAQKMETKTNVSNTKKKTKVGVANDAKATKVADAKVGIAKVADTKVADTNDAKVSVVPAKVSIVPVPVQPILELNPVIEHDPESDIFIPKNKSVTMSSTSKIIVPSKKKNVGSIPSSLPYPTIDTHPESILLFPEPKPNHIVVSVPADFQSVPPVSESRPISIPRREFHRPMTPKIETFSVSETDKQNLEWFQKL